MRAFKLSDSHCHLHAMEEEARKYEDMLIVAVSEDLPTSRKTTELAGTLNNVIPCIGLHPWKVARKGTGWIKELEKLIDLGAKCVGEIGLDKVFYPKTYEEQLSAFKAQVKLAKEYGLPVNLHALGAWREVLDILMKEDIERAVIHWYVGPIDLIEEIREAGYFLSVNPIIEVEEAHKAAVKKADIEMLLTESDAPYEYKGIKLRPEKVKESIGAIASLKGISEEEVTQKVLENLKRYLGSRLL